MEKINVNYHEEKILRLFAVERKPLTAAQLHDHLKSLDFGGSQYILQSLVRKKLLSTKITPAGTHVYYPSPTAIYYYAKSGGIRDDAVDIDNKDLRKLATYLERLETVDGAKKSIAELKLERQNKVIELWRVTAMHDGNESDASAHNVEICASALEDELDDSMMVIEVKNNDFCYPTEIESDPQLKAVSERKIDLLHRYNEIKEFAHALLAILAEEQLTTVKQLYGTFNMQP